MSRQELLVLVTKLFSTSSLPSLAGDVHPAWILYADLRRGSGGPLRIVIPTGSGRTVGTGIAVAIPSGCIGLLCPYAPLAMQNLLKPAVAPSLISSMEHGELEVLLHNDGRDHYSVYHGDPIAYLLFVPCALPVLACVSSLPPPIRSCMGGGGEGSHA